MMTREERAKQFMAFDAMKGLCEALREREMRHFRVKKQEISEEQQNINTQIIYSLKKYDNVKIFYYKDFSNIESVGRVYEINLTFKYIKIRDEKIFFADIYSIEKV